MLLYIRTFVVFITQNNIIFSITNLSVVALIISGLVCCEFSLRGLEDSLQVRAKHVIRTYVRT